MVKNAAIRFFAQVRGVRRGGVAGQKRQADRRGDLSEDGCGAGPEPVEQRGELIGRRDPAVTRSVRVRLSTRSAWVCSVSGVAARKCEPAPQHGVFGRERALSTLAFAGWVDSLLLWLAWRLLPADALPGQVSPPRP